MSTRSPPAVLAFFQNEPNVAADAALVEALPDMDPNVQSAAIDLLLQRGHAPSLSAVIRRFEAFPEPLRALIAAQMDRLTPATRIALASPEVGSRLGAIELIRLGHRCELAYLLVGALRSACSRTQERAAAALNAMTAKLLANRPSSNEDAEYDAWTRHANELTEALREGVAGWEAHFQVAVLEAATWMFDRLENSITTKLHDRRSKLPSVLIGLLRGTPDLRRAGFVLWAYTVPSLQEASAAAMCNSRDPQWGRALVERGAESLCDRLCDQIAHGPVRERVRALSIVRCLGLVSKIKDSVLRLTGDADATVRSLAVAMLGDLPGEASERVLCAAVDDPDARVQANAVEALDKLDVPNRLQCTQTKLTSPHGRVRANAIKSLLRLDMRRAAGELLRMLEDGSCSQRVSALWVVQRLELRSVLQRVVSLSRHDPDDRVKQRARRVLQELEGHTPPQGSSGLPTASSKPPQRMQGTWK